MSAEKHGYQYDFFIYYTDEDREWAEGVLKASLQDRKLRCLSPLDFRPGHLKTKELEDAIISSERVLLILSPEYVNNEDIHNQFFSSMVLHHGSKVRGWPLIPVFREKTPLPLRLDTLVGLDFYDNSSINKSLKRLFEVSRLPVSEIPETKKIDPPYPGLRAFNESEAKFFYGRNKEVKEILHKLQWRRFVAIIGASGSGKSSLVYAGIIPSMKAEEVFFGERQILFLDSIRPTYKPIEKAKEFFGNWEKSSLVILIDKKLQENNKKFAFVFIDQFEEVFTINKKEQDDFFDLLLGLINNQKIYLIITIRDDFYHKLMATPLRDAIKTDRYDLDPLNRDNLRAVITEPALRVGVFIDKVLVEKLVNDAGDEPGILPFLQETMLYLWVSLQYRYLPEKTYNTLEFITVDGKIITGLRATIAKHCEEAFKYLSKSEQEIAKCILIRLVQFGNGVPDTRLQVSIDDLRPCGQSDVFEKVLNILTSKDYRFLTLSEDRVDISHEALIVAWLSNKDWVNHIKDAEKERRLLLSKAHEWEKLGKKAGFLDKTQLNEIKNIFYKCRETNIQLNPIIYKYIEASKKSLKRRKIQMALFSVLSVLVVTMMTMLSWLIYKNHLKNIVINHNPLVKIKGGLFKIGSNEEPNDLFYPEWKTSLPDFYVESYEVDNYSYCMCYKSGNCVSHFYNDTNVCAPERSNLPVTNMSLYKAVSYCKWLNRKIPSESEWEIAAKGKESRQYPIGNYLNDENSKEININNKSDNVIDTHENNGDKTPGENPIFGLTGNVSEWTTSPGLKYSDENYMELYKEENWRRRENNNRNIEPLVVYKGGNFTSDYESANTLGRYFIDPSTEVYFIGFRCVSTSRDYRSKLK